MYHDYDLLNLSIFFLVIPFLYLQIENEKIKEKQKNTTNKNL